MEIKEKWEDVIIVIYAITSRVDYRALSASGWEAASR